MAAGTTVNNAPSNLDLYSSHTATTTELLAASAKVKPNLEALEAAQSEAAHTNPEATHSTTMSTALEATTTFEAQDSDSSSSSSTITTTTIQATIEARPEVSDGTDIEEIYSIIDNMNSKIKKANHGKISLKSLHDNTRKNILPLKEFDSKTSTDAFESDSSEAPLDFHKKSSIFFSSGSSTPNFHGDVDEPKETIDQIETKNKNARDSFHSNSNAAQNIIAPAHDNDFNDSNPELSKVEIFETENLPFESKPFVPMPNFGGQEATKFFGNLLRNENGNLDSKLFDNSRMTFNDENVDYDKNVPQGLFWDNDAQSSADFLSRKRILDRNRLSTPHLFQTQNIFSHLPYNILEHDFENSFLLQDDNYSNHFDNQDETEDELSNKEDEDLKQKPSLEYRSPDSIHSFDSNTSPKTSSSKDNTLNFDANDEKPILKAPILAIDSKISDVSEALKKMSTNDEEDEEVMVNHKNTHPIAVSTSIQVQVNSLTVRDLNMMKAKINKSKQEQFMKLEESYLQKQQLLEVQEINREGFAMTGRNKELLIKLDNIIANLKTDLTDLEVKMRSIVQAKSPIIPEPECPVFGTVNDVDFSTMSSIKNYDPSDSSIMELWRRIISVAKQKNLSEEALKTILFTKLHGKAARSYETYQSRGVIEIVKLLSSEFDQPISKASILKEIHSFSRGKDECLLNCINRLKNLVYSAYKSKHKTEQDAKWNTVLNDKLRFLVSKEVYTAISKCKQQAENLGNSYSPGDLEEKAVLEEDLYNESALESYVTGLSNLSLNPKRKHPDQTHSSGPIQKRPNSPSRSPSPNLSQTRQGLRYGQRNQPHVLISNPTPRSGDQQRKPGYTNNSFQKPQQDFNRDESNHFKNTRQDQQQPRRFQPLTSNDFRRPRNDFHEDYRRTQNYSNEDHIKHLEEQLRKARNQRHNNYDNFNSERRYNNYNNYSRNTFNQRGNGRYIRQRLGVSGNPPTIHQSITLEEICRVCMVKGDLHTHDHCPKTQE